MHYCDEQIAYIAALLKITYIVAMTMFVQCWNDEMIIPSSHYSVSQTAIILGCLQHEAVVTVFTTYAVLQVCGIAPWLLVQ